MTDYGICARDEKGRGAHREKSAKCRYSLVDNEEGENDHGKRHACRREIEIVGLVADGATDRAVTVRGEEEFRK